MMDAQQGWIAFDWEAFLIPCAMKLPSIHHSRTASDGTHTLVMISRFSRTKLR